jgi:hypothetical protein
VRRPLISERMLALLFTFSCVLAMHNFILLCCDANFLLVRSLHHLRCHNPRANLLHVISDLGLSRENSAL